MENVIIKGTGYKIPEKRVTNDTLLQRLNSTNEFIVNRTGVETRYHVNINEKMSDLAIPAMSKALENANLEAKDIDLLIVNTLSPDHHDPSQACLLQAALDFRHIPVFDIRAQCSGFLYGAKIAIDGIKSGSYNNVMIVCGEVLSKRADYSDAGRNLTILLGDGAGAIILGKDKSSLYGFKDIILGADGNYFKLLWTESPGTSNATFHEGNPFFRMTGHDMFEHATKTLANCVIQILHQNNLNLEDIDLIIPHQPNLRILESVGELLEVNKEKIYINVTDYGNIASASLPIAIAMAKEQKLMQENHKYIFLAYGSGATWGAALYQN